MLKAICFLLLIVSISNTNALPALCSNIVNCFVDPCRMATITGCPSYPGAQCVSNYCGGCYADWYYNGVKVNCYTKSEEIKKAETAEIKKNEERFCLNMVTCFVQPCAYARCPAYPNAVCVDNYCGGCFANFYVNGVQVYC